MDQIVDQVIDITNGMRDYTLPWTLSNNQGRDLTPWVSTVQLSLGTSELHGTWHSPDIISQPDESTIVAQILVGVASATIVPTVGTYFLWRTISPNPQILPVRTPLRIKVI